MMKLQVIVSSRGGTVPVEEGLLLCDPEAGGRRDG